jgi:hypothetical protein
MRAVGVLRGLRVAAMAGLGAAVQLAQQGGLRTCREFKAIVDGIGAL